MHLPSIAIKTAEPRPGRSRCSIPQTSLCRSESLELFKSRLAEIAAKVVHRPSAASMSGRSPRTTRRVAPDSSALARWMKQRFSGDEIIQMARHVREHGVPRAASANATVKRRRMNQTSSGNVLETPRKPHTRRAASATALAQWMKQRLSRNEIAQIACRVREHGVHRAAWPLAYATVKQRQIKPKQKKNCRSYLEEK